MSRSDGRRATGVDLLQDLSRIAPPTEGYLRRHRHRVKTRLEDGTRTEAYVVDYVDRTPDKRDAAAIALFARAEGGAVEDTRVLLRRQVRYAAWVVAGRPLVTEVHAGLIEGGEPPEACAVREVWEEAGLEIEAADVIPLGPPFFMLPGIFTERIVPLAVELPRDVLEAAVDLVPPGDGSPFEEGVDAIALSLGEIFAHIERGAPAATAPATTAPATASDAIIIDDAKTELVLTRLWRHLEASR